MIEYKKLLEDILENGEERGDRTGTGTKSIFAPQMKFDLQKGFPAVTTKKLYWKGVVVELLWFLRGDTNVKYLQDNNVKIWDEWADKNGDLGPVYGSQWRSWNGTHDQIQTVIESLRDNPTSRRHIVSAWNVSSLEDMALPPCHMTFQFYVRKGKFLDIQVYQRSADAFLGVPFNIASYALLTHIIADIVNLKPGVLTHTLGDAHIYLNHLDAVNTLLERDCKSLPTLKINKKISLEDLDVDNFNLSYKDFELVDYKPHPTIKAEISV